jgi:hypothetical protein
MYYAHFDGYASPVFGGGFANTKSLVAFATRKARSAVNMQYTPITRREAERFYGRKTVESIVFVIK